MVSITRGTEGVPVILREQLYQKDPINQIYEKQLRGFTDDELHQMSVAISQDLDGVYKGSGFVIDDTIEVFVVPEYRGQGVGTNIVRSLKAVTGKETYHVVLTPPEYRNRDFWERNGITVLTTSEFFAEVLERMETNKCPEPNPTAW